MKKVVIFYDSIQSPLNTKKSMLSGFSSEGIKVHSFSSKDLTDGKRIEHVENIIRSVSDLDVVGVIWNGRELGCNLIKQLFIKHDIKFTYLEQGIMPQSKNLRFMSLPIHESGVRETFKIDPFLIKEKKIDIKGKKIAVVYQLPYDSSMFRLLEPKVDFQEEVLSYLNNKTDTRELDFVLCPHPKATCSDYINIPNHFAKNFNSVQLSTLQNTEAECKNAGLVIGWNSTMLLELAAKGENVVALDKSSYAHIVNLQMTTEELLEHIQKYQFSPENESGKSMFLRIKES